MKIQICVYCYGYEKRFNWMLSSIKECVRVGKNDIIVDVVTLDDTDKLDFDCGHLKDHFNFLNVTKASMSKFKNRALCRNYQVANLKPDIDAVLFADADHLYDPMFFDELSDKALEVRNMSDQGRYMYTTRRTSTDDLDKLNEIIDKFAYPCVISDPIKQYGELNTRLTSAPGAGNTQFVFTKDILDGTYVRTEEIRDRTFFRRISYRSDITFRRKFDNVIKLDLKAKQYHLQHDRYSYNELIQQ